MLDKIVAHKRKMLARIEQSEKVARMEKTIADLPPPVSLMKNITADNDIAIIAEIKRKSPSKGVLYPDLDVRQIAETYEVAGACGISVLTDEKFFDGSIEDLRAVRQCTDLPILRKDFILSEFQIYEARAIGADLILLIAAILEKDRLLEFNNLANRLNLEVLVEVHDREELESALELDNCIIGINNRDLKTFETDLGTFQRLSKHLPKNRTVVAESGIYSREDILKLKEWGANAVLVGESIVTSSDPGATIMKLRGIK